MDEPIGQPSGDDDGEYGKDQVGDFHLIFPAAYSLGGGGFFQGSFSIEPSAVV